MSLCHDLGHVCDWLGDWTRKIGDWALICSSTLAKSYLLIMFYEAPCWTSIFCSSTRLAEVDSVLTCTMQMALRHQYTTFVEVPLALVEIDSVRYHVSGSWWHKGAFIVSSFNPIYN